jgi:hypothetical protein
MIRIDKTVSGVSLAARTVSAYVVLDAPVGDLADADDIEDVIAELLSFCASTGADTTIKYDCSGNGAAALVAGSL